MRVSDLYDDERGAVFSTCRRYRYRLWRRISGDPGTVAFIGLNPSTADEREDDPTIRRCIGFARAWGYGRLEMLNLFAFRATKPKVMMAEPWPVSPAHAASANDDAILRIGRRADLVIAAWGVPGRYRGRALVVRRALQDAHIALHYLRLTKDGHPGHPLYLLGDLMPVRWS